MRACPKVCHNGIFYVNLARDEEATVASDTQKALTQHRGAHQTGQSQSASMQPTPPGADMPTVPDHPDESVTANGRPLSVQLGQRVHQAIARLMEAGVAEERPERQLQVLMTAAEVLSSSPIEGKHARAAALEVATATACYLRRFLLDPTWEFIGSERPLGGGRGDLLFRSTVTGEWLLDEVKHSRGRNDEPHLRPQIDRYIRGGVERWGEAFLGVRLCSLAQPRESRFYTPHSKRSVSLRETRLHGGVA